MTGTTMHNITVPEPTQSQPDEQGEQDQHPFEFHFSILSGDFI
jgi:hypothetical protein